MSLSSTLAARLSQAHAQPIAEILTDEVAGPAGLTIVRARLPDAYPGAGVITALRDGSGAEFGKHTRTPTSLWFQGQGWLVAPPAASLLSRVLSFAEFDGLLAFSDDPAPTVTATGTSVRLDGVAGRSGRPSRVTTTVAIDAVTTLVWHVEDVPVPPLLGRAATLRQAIDRRVALDIGNALRAMSAPLTADDAAALANAVVVCGAANSRLAASRLGSTPMAVSALLSALSSLSLPERATLLARLQDDGAGALVEAVRERLQ